MDAAINPDVFSDEIPEVDRKILAMFQFRLGTLTAVQPRRWHEY
jgi:hypothetical protein